MDRLGLRCTRPVGSYPAGRSWCGAEEMAGNVWEWVADGYVATTYQQATRLDPFLAARVLHGPRPATQAMVIGRIWP